MEGDGFPALVGTAPLGVDDFQSPDTELWLLKLPKQIDAESLHGLKFTVGAPGPEGSKAATVDAGEQRVDLLESGRRQLDQLVNLWPTGSKSGKLATGKPFARGFDLRVVQAKAADAGGDAEHGTDVKAASEALQKLLREHAEPVPQVEGLKYKFMMPGADGKGKIVKGSSVKVVPVPIKATKRRRAAAEADSDVGDDTSSSAEAPAEDAAGAAGAGSGADGNEAVQESEPASKGSKAKGKQTKKEKKGKKDKKKAKRARTE